MSEFTRLTEQLPTHLETEPWTLVLSDGAGRLEREKIHLPVSINSPWDLDLTQFIPNLPIDHDGLIELIGSVISDAQDRAGIVDSQRVKFVEDFHPDEFANYSNEIISYKILKREPARMSRDGLSRPNRLFNAEYEHASSQELNKVLCVEARPIDIDIELSVWASTATLANARALWLERLLISQRFAFTSKGVKPFFWKERRSDVVWTHNGIRLRQRPMVFFARLKEYNVLAYPTIREFVADLTIQT